MIRSLMNLGTSESRLLSPTFQIGRVYKRWPEINDIYGGSRQSGISASSRSRAIFLFTGESGEQYGYQDHFDELGVFWYTGEGQIGDMTLTRGNRAIAEHSRDGRALHVFATLAKGQGQRYLGEFTYASHELKKGPDKTGSQRQIIVFHLIPLQSPLDQGKYWLEDALATPSLDIEEARQLAIASLSPAESQGATQALRTLYRRSKAVRDYVLMRSAGVCESCKQAAPFLRTDGTSYLEPHHTTRVSDGGLDHPKHVGAICPTCHREIHYGIDGTVRNLALIEYLEKIEPN